MSSKAIIDFYNRHKACIHPVIKSNQITKPLWRKLFWTTARDGNEYKAGCVAILKQNMPDLYKELIRADSENQPIEKISSINDSKFVN